jgi:hypothetical protein
MSAFIVELFKKLLEDVLAVIVPRIIEIIIRHASRLALRLKPAASGVVSVTLPRIRVHGDTGETPAN